VYRSRELEHALVIVQIIFEKYTARSN